MVKREFALAALLCAGIAASVNGAITFTFFDPEEGPEIIYTTGSDDMNPGMVEWTNNGPVTLTVDGSDHGLGVEVFSANVFMNLQIGAVASEEGGTFIAPILGGSFSFEEVGSGDTILEAMLGDDSGAVLALGTTGNIIAQGDGSPSGLTFAAGDALMSFLNGMTLAPIFDANFTLTGMDEPATVASNGFLEDFSANSAFSGNAQVPSPGTLALAGLSVATLTIRRKR